MLLARSDHISTNHNIRQSKGFLKTMVAKDFSQPLLRYQGLCSCGSYFYIFFQNKVSGGSVNFSSGRVNYMCLISTSFKVHSFLFMIAK